MNEPNAETRKGVLRTALLLAAVAAAFYLGFIMMGVLNA